MKKLKNFWVIAIFLLFAIPKITIAETCSVTEESVFESAGTIYYATIYEDKIWLYETGGSSNSFNIEVIGLNNPQSPTLEKTLPFQYKDEYSFFAGAHLFDFLENNYIIAVGTKPANLINISTESSSFVNFDSGVLESEVFSNKNYIYVNGKNDNYIDIYEFKNNSILSLGSFKACNDDNDAAKISFLGNGYIGIKCENYSKSKYVSMVYKLNSFQPITTNFEISGTSYSEIVNIDSSYVYFWAPDSENFTNGELKIYDLTKKNLVTSIPMDGCSRNPKIFGKYSVCVKNEMGFMLYDLTTKNKIAEWEDKDSNIWGAIPFSKNNDLYVALWAVWLGNNQNSGFKIFKINNLSDCSSTSLPEQPSTEIPTNCSVYDFNTRTFNLKCAKIGNELYSMDMKITEANETSVTFQITKYSKITQSSENCSYFNFFTNTFHIPCIKVSDKLFKIDLYLSSPEGNLKLKGANYY